MFQNFLEPAKILIAGCDIIYIYGLMEVVVVVIFYPYFTLTSNYPGE